MHFLTSTFLAELPLNWIGEGNSRFPAATTYEQQRYVLTNWFQKSITNWLLHCAVQMIFILLNILFSFHHWFILISGSSILSQHSNSCKIKPGYQLLQTKDANQASWACRCQVLCRKYLKGMLLLFHFWKQQVESRQRCRDERCLFWTHDSYKPLVLT